MLSVAAHPESEHGLLIQVVASRESDRETLSRAVMQAEGVRLTGSVPFDVASSREPIPKPASIIAAVRTEEEMSLVRAIASRDPAVVVVALYSVGSEGEPGAAASAEKFALHLRSAISQLLTSPDQLRIPLSEADKADRKKYQLLTRREREVLLAIAEGLSGREIAARLFRSGKTIERHRATLMAKLDMHDRVALARFAYRLGLTKP